MDYRKQIEVATRLLKAEQFEESKKASAEAIQLLLNWPPDEEKAALLVTFYYLRGSANCAIGLRDNEPKIYRYGQSDFLNAIGFPACRKELHYDDAFISLKRAHEVLADFGKYVAEFQKNSNVSLS